MSDTKIQQPVFGSTGDVPKAKLLDDDDVEELVAKKAAKKAAKPKETY